MEVTTDHHNREMRWCSDKYHAIILHHFNTEGKRVSKKVTMLFHTIAAARPLTFPYRGGGGEREREGKYLTSQIRLTSSGGKKKRCAFF